MNFFLFFAFYFAFVPVHVGAQAAPIVQCAPAAGPAPLQDESRLVLDQVKGYFCKDTSKPVAPTDVTCAYSPKAIADPRGTVSGSCFNPGGKEGGVVCSLPCSLQASLNNSLPANPPVPSVGVAADVVQAWCLKSQPMRPPLGLFFPAPNPTMVCDDTTKQTAMDKACQATYAGAAIQAQCDKEVSAGLNDGTIDPTKLTADCPGTYCTGSGMEEDDLPPALHASLNIL